MGDKRIEILMKRCRDNHDIPLPKYQTDGSSGMDLRADIEGEVVLNPGDIRLVPTGIMISVPPGYEGQVRPRSGLALSHGIGMVNAPGTIDSDYRGEIGVILINWGKRPFTIKRGDRIAQLIITKVYKANVIETEELDMTQRSQGGFGHTGKH